MQRYLCQILVVIISSLLVLSLGKPITSPEDSLIYEDVPAAYYSNNLWGEKRAGPVMPYPNAAFRPWANIRNTKRISEQEIRSVLKNAWLG